VDGKIVAQIAGISVEAVIDGVMLELTRTSLATDWMRDRCVVEDIPRAQFL
jgi:hypothetical protein